jgi:hypothetical protein
MTRSRAGNVMALFALVFILIQTDAALAQETETLPQRRTVVWVNPILAVFTWYMAEVEIRLQSNHTVGVGGSFLQTEDGEKDDPTQSYEKIQYTSVNAFYRYYPTASFKGFFIGGQLGFASVDREARDYDFISDTLDSVDESGTAMLAGVLIGYGWVLGDAQRVAVSLGIGANRFFGGDVPDDASATLPVIRALNVGIAF